MRDPPIPIKLSYRRERMIRDKVFYYGTGRRKTAVARVRLYPSDNGEIIVNEKPYSEYFPILRLQEEILSPFKATGFTGKFRVVADVRGGGVSAQAQAVRHGIARALVEFDPSLKKILKDEGLLTRDPREKERKKYGRIRARKRKQYRKR